MRKVRLRPFIRSFIPGSDGSAPWFERSNQAPSPETVRPGTTDRSFPNGCGSRTQRSRAVAWCGGAGRSDHAATRATPPPLAVGEPLESPRLPFRSTRAARRGGPSSEPTKVPTRGREPEIPPNPHPSPAGWLAAARSEPHGRAPRDAWSHRRGARTRPGLVRTRGGPRRARAKTR